MPDGCEPLPDSLYQRITEQSLSSMEKTLEKGWPDLKEITAPLSSEEKRVLENLGGVSLVESVQTLFSDPSEL
jgi:hypothetical protein